MKTIDEVCGEPVGSFQRFVKEQEEQLKREEEIIDARIRKSINQKTNQMKTEKFPSIICAFLTVIGLCAFAMIVNISLSSCAEFTKAETDISATAKAFEANPVGYLESVAVQVQKVNTVASNVVDNVDSVLQAAGLAPADSKQQKLIDDLKVQLKTAQGRVDAVNAILTPSHLSTVANPPTAMLKLHSEIRAPFGSRKHESIYDLSVTKD